MEFRTDIASCNKERPYRPVHNEEVNCVSRVKGIEDLGAGKDLDPNLGPC